MKRICNTPVLVVTDTQSGVDFVTPRAREGSISQQGQQGGLGLAGFDLCLSAGLDERRKCVEDVGTHCLPTPWDNEGSN